MKNPRLALLWLTALAIAALAGTGCGTHSTRPASPELRSARPSAAPYKPVDSGACAPLIPFAAANFSHGARINNPYLPFVSGTQYVLEGRADRGGGLLPHRVVFTVTDVVKVIDGVPNLVMWDRDYSDGELVEAELAFFAQDDQGNVWSLGEYPEEYEDGVFVGAPSVWISGLDGAIGGLHMLANPSLGTGGYLQGSAPAIDFLDCAKVFKTGESTCVPIGCFSNVLVTDERSPLEPGSGSQRKYHARGVGIVQVGAVGDKEGETLVMVERRQLSTREMREARREALRLDANAYRVSEVYRLTSPAY